jgi:hypothetical protein
VRHGLSAGIFFLGVFLTGFSSSYYHFAPSDWGLFWDRLPMTFAFMAILANVIEERVDARAGKFLLWPLVALGVISLLVWMRFDDLRLYAWVQFFPCIAVPLMFWLLPPKYTATYLWFVAAGPLCSGQASRTLRRGDLCGARRHERSSDQARRRRRRLLRDLSGVSDADTGRQQRAANEKAQRSNS